MDHERTQMTGEDPQYFAEKLLAVEKKQYSMLRIMMAANVILAAGIVLALLLVVPRLISVANDAEKTLTEVQTLAESAEKSLDGIDEVVSGANTTIAGAGKLLEDNAEAVEEALSNLNEIDFESLNKAIRDLSKVVEPLARVTGVFS